MIPVTKLRDLFFATPVGDERSSHLSAASGLAHIGSTLFVIADDEKQLSIFPNEAREPGHQIQILPGPVPDSDEERAKTKPDLESLVVLPPWTSCPQGALMTLASGTKERDQAVLIPLRDNALPGPGHRQIDLSPLYDMLRSQIEDFNIEGCAVQGETLHLFQRGTDHGGPNARIDLSLNEALAGLDSGAALLPEHVIGITEYDLGRLKGVKLCFSDASPLPDGRLVFTCSAETSGSGDDGSVAGSAIGTMEPGGEVSMVEPFDLEVKIEGMTAIAHDQGIRVLLVADADDPATPSALMEARLETP